MSCWKEGCKPSWDPGLLVKGQTAKGCTTGCPGNIVEGGSAVLLPVFPCGTVVKELLCRLAVPCCETVRTTPQAVGCGVGWKAERGWAVGVEYSPVALCTTCLVNLIVE